MRKTYKVKDIARITGVSVRTLHYYDEIKLLEPSGRTDAGYRLYNDDDLLRMQQILIGRSLGMPLEEIRQWLDDPDFDYVTSLRKQRALLVERLSETNEMISAIDKTLDVLENPDKEPDFEALFDGFNPADYEQEVAERWGNTDAYRQSAQRTSTYGEAEWKAIRDELDTIFADAAQAMRAGQPTDGRVALDLVERHRQHICRWYYNLPQGGHVQLADMWKNDDRFRKNIDEHGEGLTTWLAAAVRASVE